MRKAAGGLCSKSPDFHVSSSHSCIKGKLDSEQNCRTPWQWCALVGTSPSL